MWQKEKLLVLSNFFFCHYVFKKLSAAEASESVYVRKRDNAVHTKTSKSVSFPFATSFFNSMQYFSHHLNINSITFPRYFQSRFLQVYCVRERINPFLHTTILQQMKISLNEYVTIENSSKHCAKRRKCSF